MHFTGDLEHRLEANTLLPNVAVGKRLGTLADRTNSSDIRFWEAILVGIDNNSILIYAKTEPRGFRSSLCNGIFVIFGVLGKFVDKASVFGVEIRCKAISNKLALQNTADCNEII